MRMVDQLLPVAESRLDVLASGLVNSTITCRSRLIGGLDDPTFDRV